MQTVSGSILDYLASVFWKVVLHLQDEACRTDVPCWHVSCSGRERKRETEGQLGSEFFFFINCAKWKKINDCHSILATPCKLLAFFQLMMLVNILLLAR